MTNDLSKNLPALLDRLQRVCLLEQDAARNGDETRLQRCGQTIDRLLPMIGVAFSRFQGNSEQEKERIKTLLMRIKDTRKASMFALEQTIEENGTAIKESAQHKKALQAYTDRSKDHEIFLKENC